MTEKGQIELLIHRKQDVILVIPARGAPIAAATPWKRHSSPKAFVNLSRPIKSTIKMDRREAKQAEQTKSCRQNSDT